MKLYGIYKTPEFGNSHTLWAITMLSSEVIEFAQILIREVRDAAIGSSDALLLPQANSPIARRWRAAKVSEKTARMLIPDSIDQAIFNLLDAIDNGKLNIKFVSSNGKEIDLHKDGMGELGGWYGASGGWLTKFATQRTFDDLDDNTCE